VTATEIIEAPEWRSEVVVPLTRPAPDIAGRDIGPNPRRMTSIVRDMLRPSVVAVAPYSVYVAGPMRGIPEFNFPMFDAAEKCARDEGWEVFSPAQHDREVYPDIEEWAGYAAGDIELCPDFDFAAAMTWDLGRVIVAEGIVLLPGWSTSTGAGHELNAALACGKDTWLYLEDEDRIVEVEPDTLEIIRDPSTPRGQIIGEVNYTWANEARTVDPVTGGEKGVKPAQMSQLDPTALLEIGEVAEFGSRKYDRYNFARGYDWSKSYDALHRHIGAWWSGENLDPESGLSHLAHAAWHCHTLLLFERAGLGTDNRFPVGA
jgi:hypothetical protein